MVYPNKQPAVASASCVSTNPTVLSGYIASVTQILTTLIDKTSRQYALDSLDNIKRQLKIRKEAGRYT